MVSGPVFRLRIDGETPEHTTARVFVNGASAGLLTVRNDELPDLRKAAAGPELYDVLHEAAEYLEGFVDVVDGDYGEPKPNRAMQLMRTIEAALAKAAP